MAFMEWKDAYSVRIPEIDEQHRGLLDIINQLHDVMKLGGDSAGLVRVVEELVSYTRYHFAWEEQMMARSGYPGLETHKAKHRAMVAQVESFRSEVSSGKASVTLRLMRFLKDWLSKHILETDMRYAAHIAAGGKA